MELIPNWMERGHHRERDRDDILIDEVNNENAKNGGIEREDHDHKMWDSLMESAPDQYACKSRSRISWRTPEDAERALIPNPSNSRNDAVNHDDQNRTTAAID
jgi:hypothetical protein